MTRAEEEKRNLYRCSNEELRCPKKGKEAWLDELIAFQREGIKHGVRPQLPRGKLSKDLKAKWRGSVWRPYCKTLPLADQKRIGATTGGSTGRSSRPFLRDKGIR